MSEDRPIVIAMVLRERGATGVQSHVGVFRRFLREQGRPVRVVTPFQNPRWLVMPVVAIRRVVETVSPSLGVAWYRRGHAFLLRRSLRRVLADTGPAVIYAQCPVSAEAALAVRESAGIKVVMAAHFNISQADEWAGKGRIREGGRAFRAIRAHEARVLPRLDGIVHVSEDVRRHVEELVPEVRHVPAVVVPNFVYPAPGPVPAAAANDGGDASHRADSGRANGGDANGRGDSGRAGAAAAAGLVSVGSLEPRKNQAYLLDILVELGRLGMRPHLTLLGDGQDRHHLAVRVRELGLQAQVSLPGVQPTAAAHLAGFRVYCHAARMESFGMAVLEAMAAGLPVVAAPVGGVPEVFRDGIEGRYWPLGDAPAAARILAGMLSDETGLAAMSRAGRERFTTTFDAQICAPRLAAFLRERGSA